MSEGCSITAKRYILPTSNTYNVAQRTEFLTDSNIPAAFCNTVKTTTLFAQRGVCKDDFVSFTCLGATDIEITIQDPPVRTDVPKVQLVEKPMFSTAKFEAQG